MEGLQYESSAAAVVPNGTGIGPTYAQLVARYLAFAQKSAESFIKLAETVVIAKTTLEPDQFSRFCADVGLEEASATCRKFLKIGNEASRFEPLVKCMPNRWTTVYKLATLDRDKFDVVAKDSRFAPTMTASEVDAILGSSPQAVIEYKRDVIIDLSGLEESRKIEVYLNLKGLEEQFGFGLKVREEIVTLANSILEAA